eukprot:snap_masked-scaffold_10-processed-gene-8.19-mRNA-1 protein AED:1.00 eAED:1.00 QI:0/-1/0/0/-1/1/1/0/73
MHFEIDCLDNLSKENCIMFISQFARLTEYQKERVNLNLKIKTRVYKKSQQTRIDHLKSMLSETSKDKRGRTNI